MMLGDIDREPSADLQQLDNLTADNNPVFNPGREDGAELAEPAAVEHQQSAGAIFAVFPEVLAFGRMPKAAYSFFTFLNVLVLVLDFVVFPFICASVAGYTDPSALLWLGGPCNGVGCVFYPSMVASLRLAVAPGAGLEQLGINEMELSDESVKKLKKWRTLAFNHGAFPWIFSGCLVFAMPFLISSERYRDICDRIPLLGAFGFHLLMNFAAAGGAVLSGLLVYHSWFLSMKIGAALAAPKVQHVIDAAKRGRPATSPEDWHKHVTRPALDLHALMSQMTQIWGRGVGCFTAACGCQAVSMLCFMLDPKFARGCDDALGLPGGFMIAMLGVFLVQ